MKFLLTEKTKIGFDRHLVGGYVSIRKEFLPQNTFDSFRRLFPPKDPHLDSRYRTRGFPNHGSFSFKCARYRILPKHVWPIQFRHVLGVLE